jgi:SAM-dependent methyltransferase
LSAVLGCSSAGIDIEEYAAKLARANLAGARVKGDIFCRDAFDPSVNHDLIGRFDLVFSFGVMEHIPDVSEKLKLAALYLKPGGKILTVVPNLQGFNWLVQRFASLSVLAAHVIYTRQKLQEVHREAGFSLTAAGYIGFADGFLTSAAGTTPLKRRIHLLVCRLLAIEAAIWKKARLPMPESWWLSPYVFYVGKSSDDSRRTSPIA